MSAKVSAQNNNLTKWSAKNGVKNGNVATLSPSKTDKPRKDSTAEKPSALKQNHNDSNSARPLKKKVTFSDAEDLKNPKKRLLLVSNRCKYGALLEKAVKPNVIAILYNYENNTLDSLLALVSATLRNDEKVISVGCIMTCKHAGIFMLNCLDNSAVLSSNTSLSKSSGIGLFFKLLFANYVDQNQPGGRLDFFGGGVVNQLDKNFKVLEEIIGCAIGVSVEQLGIGKGSTSDSGEAQTLGDIYFAPDKIRNWTNGSYQTIELFEKIRTVGKGAFGTAVLYRKKDDNSLVILKEINMSELNSQERQLAMNETKVLKMLNHPNIICCYDSFEENGVLMIEMEYADDGTLAQFLAKQETPSSETFIITMFAQIVSGIRYMHEQKVLHRDLKTANIFLTKEGLLKIGDFGVSKIMSSHNKGANTVLGTPYYISPEICEGKPYNEKSDIWALGCILHEMATRQKTFESTNLPALVNKIMRGQIAPIQGNFSPEFKQLVHDMLHRDPEQRPTAQMLDVIRLPDLLDRFEGSEGGFSTGKPTTKASRDVSSASRRQTRSVLYSYDTSAMTISPPVEGFPSKIQIRQVAIGENHYIAVGMELAVYTWGQNDYGQLGHGSLEPCTKPHVVEALKGKSVTSACAGSSFSIFVSDNGIVMTCGNGRYGCLGHGDYVSAQRPRLIEALLSVDVSVVACGSRHVVALGNEGEVFAWGDGKDGCLGLGNTDIKEQPTQVPVDEGVAIRDIRCSVDGTMFITEVGTLLACGNNRHNRLGLNERRGFLTVLSNKLKLEVESRKSPTPVKAIKGVVDVAMGRDHSAILTESGDVYMLGSNKHAQLGIGDNKARGMPVVLKSLRDYDIGTLICGDKHTAAGTTDGSILFWGTRYRPTSISDDFPISTMVNAPTFENEGKEPPQTNIGSHNLLVKPTHRRTVSGASTASYRSTLSLNQEQGMTSEGPSRASSIQDISSVSNDKAVNSRTTNDFDLDSTASTPTNTANSPLDLRMPEIVVSPRVILNIGTVETPFDTATSTPDSTTVKSDASKGLADEKATLNEGVTTNYAAYLDCLIPCAENFFILVGTDAPLTALKPSSASNHNEMQKKRHLKTQISYLNLSVPRRNQRNSASSNEAGDEYTSSEASEMDSFGTAPTWIREELKRSLEAVAQDSPAVAKSSSKKKIPETPVRPSTLKAGGNTKRKNSPSPSRIRVTESTGGVDRSSSDSSNQSVVKQPVNRLSVETVSSKTPSKGGRKSRSPSPYMRRSAQPNYNRNRMARGRGRLGHWDPPKPSRSPVRDNLHDLRAKVTQLQTEKRTAEKKLKEVQDRNENMLRELQVRHEKEKLEQERWLHDQIAMLKKQLDDQQREINERELRNEKTIKQNSQNSTFKNSKICNIQ